MFPGSLDWGPGARAGVEMRRLQLLGVLLTCLLCAAPARADGPSTVDRIFFLQHHTFSRAEARVRVQQLLDYWKNRFGLVEKWRGNVAHVEGKVWGVEIDADVTVGDHEVSAETTDPGVFWRSAAVEYVRKKLRKYLHPNYQEG